MSTFTLAICLTTSNLPWFMDLTFQVPVQYCFLQHRTLLLLPVTPTVVYYFCFASIPSFFLELFLHWPPVVYWAPTDLGSSSFSILSFCLFILSILLYHLYSREVSGLFATPWTVFLSMGFSRQEYWSVHWKDWCWSWNSNTLATWCEDLTHWKRPWFWERLKAGEEGVDRGWDGWMASPTWWR